MDMPNLAGVATANLVEKLGGTFQASYINWSRTLQMLREHAPGWLPEVVPAADGGLLHDAPVGCYLLIRFRNGEQVTPAVPQAVMNTKNNAIPRADITARDVTDTHRRGICLAAAMTFGLAYELWAKLPLESGYVEDEEAPKKKEPELRKIEPKGTIKATDGAEKFVDAERKKAIDEMLAEAIELWNVGREIPAVQCVHTFGWEHEEEKVYAFAQLQSYSKFRSALKANKPQPIAA